MKLLLINYNNQRVVVELVTYLDSHVLGFVQRSKPRIGICASDWLVTYWELCIKRIDCHYRIGPIGYWGKGSIVGWYKVLGFFYL